MLLGGGGLYQAGVGEDMMMKLAGTFGAVASVMMLSGCLGGGGSETPEARLERGQRLYDRIEQQPYTDAAAMPTAGSATYVGAAVFGAGTDSYNVSTPVIGDLTMTADFSAASVNGTVSRIQDIDSRRMMAGSIGLNGSITGSNIAGTVSGSVDTYRVDGNFAGGFTGAGADYVFGEVEGTVGGIDYIGLFGGEKR